METRDSDHTSRTTRAIQIHAGLSEPKLRECQKLAFRIRDILVRIWILEYVPLTTDPDADPDPYQNLL